MSAAFSQVDDYVLNDTSGISYLHHRFGVNTGLVASVARVAAPSEGEFPRVKVASLHHTHYRPETLWRVGMQYQHLRLPLRLLLWRLRQIDGLTEASISSFMIYIMFVERPLAYLLVLGDRVWEKKDLAGFSERLASLSVPLKSLQCHTGVSLTQLFELNVLINRGVGDVDWEAEMHDRMRPTTVNVPADEVRAIAREVFHESKRHGYRYKAMDLDTYIATRWEWIPAGSIHSQYEEDRQYIFPYHMHRTKFASINAMPAGEIRKIFERKPEIHAWASVKYEWAKQRAIYGVDLTSTLITNFAMFRCEQALMHRFPVGDAADEIVVHKRLNNMLADNESYCYDFDNFNAQHSVDAMRAVLWAFYDVFSECMSDEQRHAMVWTISSLDSMVVHNNYAQCKQYRTSGTLLSGWRLTTFINTVLNYVYFKASGAFGVGGIHDSVHNGDDVLLSVSNLRACVLAHACMARIGARAQLQKCNVFSIGEFLRVDHKLSAKRGLGAQYLSRASATLAHSRIEAHVPQRLTDNLAAMETRMTEMLQRSKGNEAIAADLMRSTLDYLSVVFNTPPEITYRLYESHVLTGGIRTDQCARVDYLFEERMEIKEEPPPGVTADEVATAHKLRYGIGDYAVYLHRHYGEFLPFKQILHKVRMTTRRQLAAMRRTQLTMTVVPQTERKYLFGRCLYRMYARRFHVPYLERSRALGIPPLALLLNKRLDKLRTILKGYLDPFYALRVLF
ncbi:MAG: RNA-dependent RNA polymerase [Sanya totivirus 6]|nr:MAG: RNA-dependent RNA polymerase [Sanya totivirus 6]